MKAVAPYIALCSLCAFISLPLTAQITVQPIKGDATISVDLQHPAPQNIPRTIFGTFLEPIGNSTYNGLWAEILQNPSFESGLWDAAHIESMVRDEPELLRSTELGLPMPWLPLSTRQGNRYEYRYGDAANSSRSLELMGIAGETTGITQRIYLPVQRELVYKGSLYARHLSGNSKITISIVSRDGAHLKLASATVDAPSTTWTKIQFTLKLEDESLDPLEQAEFQIALQGDSRVLIDQASLMPEDALDGLDPDVVQAARDMHTPLVRFGGNFTSGYHWRDGVGPLDKRISMPNIAWGIPEYNTFGTDEFLHFCQLIHAEPQIALNLGSGTPDEAADWVQYVNTHWMGNQGGLLWELGNELWGDWNTGWPTLPELAPRTLAFSRAIHAVDPKARLIATGQDPDRFQDWNAAQLSNPAGTENYLSTHFVETTNDVLLPDASTSFMTQATLALPIGLERSLAAMHNQIEATRLKGTVQIAFTEWLFVARDHHLAPNYTNFAGALTAAGMFNMLMRASPDVPVSDMTGIMELAGIWKKRGVVYRTPSAYVLGMFAGAPIEHLLPVKVESGSYTIHNGSSRIPDIDHVPFLDVDAAISKDGRTVTLFVINRDLDRDSTARLMIPGLENDSKAEVETLSSPDLYAENDEITPEAIIPQKKLIAVKPELHYIFPKASFTKLTLSVN